MHKKMEERPPRASEILRHIPAVSYFFVVAVILASAGWFLAALKFSRLEMETRESRAVEIAGKRIIADLQPVLSDLKLLSNTAALSRYFEHPSEQTGRDLDLALLSAGAGGKKKIFFIVFFFCCGGSGCV